MIYQSFLKQAGADLYGTPPQASVNRVAASVAPAATPASSAKASPAPKTSGVMCFNCKEIGHKNNACPSIVCRNCGGLGHMGKECKNNSKIVCHRCGTIGHKSPDCPQNKKVTAPAKEDQFCLECGRLGHTVASCPATVIKNVRTAVAVSEKYSDLAKTTSSADGDKTAAPSNDKGDADNDDDDDDIVVLDESPPPRDPRNRTILMDHQVSRIVKCCCQLWYQELENGL